jgi:2,3-bisphosphoglycerate-dependent phosphoglycerate mutase
MKHGTLILLRHGQSEWNRVGRFTGWTDVPLSPGGRAESRRAAQLLARRGLAFDRCHASVLSRSIATAEIVLAELGRSDMPIARSWRLNERHYGALQGLGPVGAALRFGPNVWRTQHDYRRQPPALDPADPRFPAFDPLYCDVPPGELPRTESLEDTLRRMLPYWESVIVPELAAGLGVLVVSHKNVLRGMRKILEGVADSDVRRIKMPTCVPWIYELDADLGVTSAYRIDKREADAKERT